MAAISFDLVIGILSSLCRDRDEAPRSEVITDCAAGLFRPLQRMRAACVDHARKIKRAKNLVRRTPSRARGTFCKLPA
jgi:hypothetical protein